MEVFEDLKYICKAYSKDFRRMVIIKITVIPAIISVATYLAVHFPDNGPLFSFSKSESLSFAVFLMMGGMLFTFARRMREGDTPKLCIKFNYKRMVTPDEKKGKMDGPRIYQLLLEIENTASYKRIDFLKVKLMEISFDGKISHRPERPLNFLGHGNKIEISINPKDKERVHLSNYEYHNGQGVDKLNYIESIDYSKIFYSVQISSGIFPAFTRYFMVEKSSGSDGFYLRDGKAK